MRFPYGLANFQALIDGQAAIQDLFGRPRLLIGHSA